MQEVCTRHGSLFILDEVMCGMGRTGTLHAWQQEEVEPDIQTLGKGLGGGYAAIAAVLLNHKVFDALDSGSGSFMHGQTYQGHPVACAAAFEVQQIIQRNCLVENVAAMGKILEHGLKSALEDHPHVGNIRGRGLFWGIEFVQDKVKKQAFDPKMGIARCVHETGLQEPFNISLYPGTGSVDGVTGDHVLLAPAYNVTADDINYIVRQTARVVQEVFSKLESRSDFPT